MSPTLRPGVSRQWSRVCITALLFVAVVSTGCLPGKPIQTNAYDWRHRLYPGEPAQRDWFVLPKKAQQRQTFQQEYEQCAKPKLQPYLRKLKALTLRCTSVAHTFHRVGSGSRVGYNLLIALGAVGGTAVLVGPILTTLKVETQGVDAGLLLTVGGAALTATAVLWLQLSELGKKTNQSFKKNADMIRLIQKMESVWNEKVCHAKSSSVAVIRASKLLSELSEQCVKDVPSVKINPNITKAIQQQQGESRAVIANYQVLQRHMDQQLQTRESQQTLARLVRQIHAAQQTLIKQAHSGEAFLRQKSQLESLCAQATGEYQRLQSLQASQTNGGNPAKDQGAVGSWSGICKSIPRYRKLHQAMVYQRELQQAQKQKTALVAQIHQLHQQYNGSNKPTAAQQRAMHAVCLQAHFAHRRVAALQASQHKAKQAVIAPGPWAGICQLYKVPLRGLSRSKL